MKLPSVKFIYSRIYDRICRNALERKLDKKYPPHEEISNRIKEFEKFWNKHKDKILTAISNIIGLKWKESNIRCYIVGRSIPYSDPLTIPAYKDVDKFIDVLTHELIHQIFMQGDNHKLAEKAWKYIFKKYKGEHFTTKIHILVHAIHKKIFLDILKDPQKLEREYESIKKNFPAQYKKFYLKSWEIVEKEGYENIIREFKDRIKS